VLSWPVGTLWLKQKKSISFFDKRDFKDGEKMYNIAIVDDDETYRNQIERYLHQYAKSCEEGEMEEYSISCFADGSEILKTGDDYFDVVFLDIEMPQVDGMTIAHEIRRKNHETAIVFITNMAQYAINGYEVNALDFIVKPVKYYDFAMKFKKVLRYLSRNANKYIVAKASGSGDVLRISCSDILYVEVIQHYLIFHTIKENVEVRGTMADMENKLSPYSFARCGKSYLVNMKYIEKLKGNEIEIRGEKLMISRSKREEFLNKFYNYLGGLK
jgi:DNA-binding LytR/AlgR family response regulator